MCLEMALDMCLEMALDVCLEMCDTYARICDRHVFPRGGLCQRQPKLCQAVVCVDMRAGVCADMRVHMHVDMRWACIMGAVEMSRAPRGGAHSQGPGSGGLAVRSLRSRNRCGTRRPKSDE